MIDGEDGSDYGQLGENGGAMMGLTGPSSRDGTDARVSLSVVEAVARAKGVKPAELETPLYDAIDPDALDELFAPSVDSGTVGFVVFTYAGYEVTVTAEGEVDVCPVE